MHIIHNRRCHHYHGCLPSSLSYNNLCKLLFSIEWIKNTHSFKCMCLFHQIALRFTVHSLLEESDLRCHHYHGCLPSSISHNNLYKFLFSIEWIKYVRSFKSMGLFHQIALRFPVHSLHVGSDPALVYTSTFLALENLQKEVWKKCLYSWPKEQGEIPSWCKL